MEDTRRITTERPEAIPADTRTSAACGWKDSDAGGYVWHWTRFSVHILRSNPARCVRRAADGGWRRTLDLPFELASIVRELPVAAAAAAGNTLPPGLAVSRRAFLGPYRTHRREAVRRLVADTPTAIIDAVTNGWMEGSFPLFRFLASCPAAVELAGSEDGARVAWLLANAHLVRDGARLGRARTMASRKRTAALDWLRLPGTPSALKQLTKIPRAAFGPGSIAAFKALTLHDDGWTRACHQPVLTEPIMRLLTSLSHDRIHNSFIDELASEPITRFGGDAVLRELEDTVGLLAGLGEMPPVLVCRAHLRDVHDDALARWTRRNAFVTTIAHRRFPAFPARLALTSSEAQMLVPLTTPHALLAEGKEMHHCLGSVPHHITGALQGSFIAFAMLRPQRLTLAFTRHDVTGEWRIYDLKGVNNAMPTRPEAWALSSSILARLNQQRGVQLQMCL